MDSNLELRPNFKVFKSSKSFSFSTLISIKSAIDKVVLQTGHDYY